MSQNKYVMSFTTGGLFYSESLLLLDIYLQLNDWDKVSLKAFETNILQSRVESTAKRILREIIGRLRTLKAGELELLHNGSPQEQKYLLWLGVCRKYIFICDFAIEVIRERYLTLKFDLPVDEFNIFFNAKEQWHEELESITEGTRNKLRSILYRILRESEIIDTNNLILPAILTDDLISIISKSNINDLSIFPISDIDMKKVVS